MLKNRSVPADVILPHITYRDVAAAIVWLAKAFGFAEHYRYGDGERVEGAQWTLKASLALLTSHPGCESRGTGRDDRRPLTRLVRNFGAMRPGQLPQGRTDSEESRHRTRRHLPHAPDENRTGAPITAPEP